MGLGRSLYFSGMSSVLSVVLRFGLSIFVAHILTPTEIGSFGVAMAASALVRAFESAGINNFIASYKDLTPALMRTIFTVNSGLNLGLALVLLLLAHPLGRFYGSDTVTTLIMVLAFATALNSHMPVLQGSLRRAMRFKALLGFDLYVLVVSTAVTVVAVLMGYGALSLAFAIVAERVAVFVIGLTVFRREVPMGFRMEEAGTVLRYGFSLSLASVVGIVGLNASNFILGRVLGLAPSAQFDRGYTLPRLIWQVVFPSFHNVLVPEVARQDREGGDHRQVVAEVARAFAMLMWPGGLVLMCVSPEIVLMLFGDQWHEAAGLTPYLLFYGIAVSPVTLSAASLIAFGHGRALVTLQLAENGVKVAVLLMAGTLGLQGLVLWIALSPLCYLVLAFSYLSRLELIAPRAFVKALWGPLRLSAVSLLPVAAAYAWRGRHTYLSLEDLLLVALGSVAVYLVGLRLWEPAFLGRLVTLIKGK